MWYKRGALHRGVEHGSITCHLTRISIWASYKMVLFKSCIWSALAAAVAGSALPAAKLHITSAQPPPAYPIGQVKGANAKVAGRLFDIDGKVQYFAGELARSRPALICKSRWPKAIRNRVS